VVILFSFFTLAVSHRRARGTNGVVAQLGRHKALPLPRIIEKIPLSLKLSHYDDKVGDFSFASRKNSAFAVEFGIVHRPAGFPPR